MNTKSFRKPVKSGRYIKSGTSNFGSNDDIFGYSFPLVTYIAENYMYDEETDSETEERDYDADDWEYRDALDEAKDLADEMNIPQYDDYSEPYLCYEPFMIKFRDGYYEGLWIEVKEGTDETPYDENGEYQGDFDWKPFTEEQMNKYADKLNEYFNKLCSDYGWQKLGVSARFSNGETWYNRIDNSRKPIKSSYFNPYNGEGEFLASIEVVQEGEHDTVSFSDEVMPLNDFLQECKDYAESINGYYIVTENGENQYKFTFETGDDIFADEPGTDPYYTENCGIVIVELIYPFDNQMAQYMENPFQ